MVAIKKNCCFRAVMVGEGVACSTGACGGGSLGLVVGCCMNESMQSMRCGNALWPL